MQTRDHVAYALCAAVSLAAAACDQGGSASREPTAQSLFPQTVGSKWLYNDVNEDGEAKLLSKENTHCETVTVDHCAAGFERTFRTVAQHTIGGGGAGHFTNHVPGMVDEALDRRGLSRAYQLELDAEGAVTGHVSYDPPVLRVLDGPYSPGRIVETRHDRCKCDLEGNCDQDEIEYRQRVLGRQTITVPAGTFEAIGFERINVNKNEVKHHWYAVGVGKVLEQQIGPDGEVEAFEELLSYEIGTEQCN